MSEWINVNERKPERYESVICCVKDSETGEKSVVTYPVWDGTQFVRLDYVYEEFAPIDGETVIYWMELPAIPEGNV